MVAALLLDGFLIVILLMMIPLGFLRGGLREICTSAGLLFGILLAGEWAERWGTWVSGRIDITEGAAQFLITVSLVVVSTALVGYGGSAAFTYRPGPGGRMYGAFLAMLNGIVFAGFLINSVIDLVYDGDSPDAIDDGFVSRALSAGFGWVLLAAFAGILGATVFGMFVRERPEDDFAYVPASTPATSRPQQSSPAPVGETQELPAQPATGENRPSQPMRIREVRHWESDEPPQREDFGKEWGQTWPNPRKQGSAFPWEQQPTQQQPSPKRVPGTQRRESPGRDRRDVLRDFVQDDDDK